jgi:Tfp pilus assembly protein PilF
MGRSPPQRSSPARAQAHVPSPLAWNAVAAAVCLWLGPLAAQTPRSCEDWSAEITTVEGRAEMQREEGSEWAPLSTGERACTGYTIHTFAASRVTIRLPDGSTERVDENTTFKLPEPPSGEGSLIEIIRGAFHIISRDPRLLRFTTPYANAGLEGTEFDIRVDEERKLTEIVVLEGEVVVTTTAGEISVKSNHIVTAREGEMPSVTPYARPIDLMRWAGHYPPVVGGPLPAADQVPMAAEQVDAEFFARRAAARLGTARVATAEDDLATALGIAPRNATALALRGLLALERADRGTARELATQALEADPTSVTALIVLSFVEHSAGELGAAERTIRRAVDLEPSNPFALTKLAELAFARGDTRAAIDHATRARTLAPADSMSLIVLGFANLRAFDVSAARDAFAAAVEVEPQAPLAHLGLGLALLRAGAEQEGLRQLELAVTLDPANAQIRSYVANVYAAENRADLSESQLGLAKEFDPDDPTPWLYSGLSDLRSNRPVTALQDLRLAAAKNRDEPVYRSSFALDEDLATRSAAIGRVYTELGFGLLAQLDAFQSIAADPTNYSAYRLLADVYSTEPRLEVARVSALYVSQLLQPANVTPIKPQLAQTSSFLAQRFGPSPLSFDELDSPVVANGPKLRASAVGGGNDTFGHDITLAGLHDALSYSGGYYRFATAGFRENNDVDQRIGNALIQYRPSAATNLQAELRSMRGEFGDLTTMFDRQLYSPISRGAEQADSVRLGVRHQLVPNHVLLGALIAQDAQSQITSGGIFSLDADQNAYSIDIQHLHSIGNVNVQSGFMLARQQSDTHTSQSVPGFGTSIEDIRDSSRQLTLYSYANYRPAPNVTLIAGVAIDDIDGTPVSKDTVSPKLGVMWRPTRRTSVRVAAFEALLGSLTTSMQNTQPRLEPVQLAGFSQLLFGSAADSVFMRGLGVEHELSPRLFVGWQADLRDIDRLVTVLGLGPGVPNQVELSERVQTAYLLWTPHDRLSINTRYEHGRYRNAFEVFGYQQMTTERLPLEIRYFGYRGLTAGARVSAVKQDGLFATPAPPPFLLPVLTPGHDSFSILDAFIGYRLANRRGFLSLNADNLLDRQFQFQDVDSTNPSMFPERLVSFRFTLAFD